MERRARFQEEPPRKEEKRREKKPKVGRLLRRKPLKSVGSFVNRIIRTLGTFTHFGDAEPEDDDGGFRAGAPCALSSGVLKEERPEESRGSSSTCREKLLYQYGDRVPGVLGLKNHGNTCFMNAVVQCLSNTDLLAEYLGLDWYKLDLKNVKGEVTEHLASLVRALWTLEYTPQLSVDFKAVVSKYGSQFRGNSQHDALEFLLWLLDRVHEDVSLATHNNNNMLGPPVTVLDGAVEVQDTDLSQARQPYIQHSFVQEHFQAQYKSSLTCPHCLKQSNTFDPFLCISLPLPLRQTRPLCVVLVFSTKGQRYQRVGFAVTLFGSVAGLRRMVADEGKLSPDQVILTEVYSSGFQRSFSDEDDLSAIGDGDTVYAFQAPPLYVRACSARLSGFHHSLPSSPYAGPEGQRLNACGTLSSEFLNHAVPMKVLLLVCNAAGAGQQAVRFGPPFLMREDRCVSWDQLQQSVLSKLYYLMINGAQAQNTRVLFNVRVVGGSVFYSYLSPADPRPLHHPAVDRALKLCGSGGPPHVKLIIEWDHRIKDCLFGNIQEEVVKDAESVKNQQQQHVQQYSCTLDECFQLYTKEEQLAPDDAWKCPHCKQLQQGVVKMSLWTLPDILILHLKRFRQVGERRNKLTTFVQFPLTDLDMAPHMVNRNHGAHQHPLQAELVPPDFLYDLYAVCNHHGGMHGGHYTASCRNSVDSQWYSYDDSSTEPVPEADVCTRGAYILFYQRRNSIPPWSAGSSLTGSTSSSTSDHWLVRLSGGSKTGSLMSTGVVSGASQSSQSPELPVFSEEHDGANGFEPFAQRNHGRSNSMRSPMKPKETANKLRWSFGPKDRTKPAAPPQTGELVQYLESGRRPRCTKEPIAALVSSPPLRNPHARGSKAGQDCSSGSGCSPNIPEGQSRVLAEREVRRLVNGSVLDGSPTKVSKSALTVHFSHSAPPSRDSTLARTKVQKGGWTHKDLLHVVLQPDDRRAQRNQEGRSHESLLSLFKSSFLKKDGTRSPVVGQDKRKNGQVASNNSTKVSNGAPTSVVPYERTAHVLPRCDSHDCRVQLANGKAGCLEPVDIKRAHSSSNIQTKMDLTFRRCASLQRNGDMVHPTHRVLVSDKPGLATLQRTRYSTTSLVPL